MTEAIKQLIVTLSGVFNPSVFTWSNTLKPVDRTKWSILATSVTSIRATTRRNSPGGEVGI